MRVSRVIILVLVVVLIAIVGLIAYGLLTAPPSTCGSVWRCAASYPLQVAGEPGVAGQQCLNFTAYVYCIGGQDTNGGPRNEVYSSSSLSASSSNITGWTSDSNHYPQFINGGSCVEDAGYVYCVGGSYNDGGDDVASSYFAPLGANGQVGNWSSTTAYPIPIDTQSCVASASFMYCVGGSNETDGSNADAAPSTSVWYAQLSPSGIGTWSHSTAYPEGITFPSCFAGDGFVYCVGGADVNGNSVSTAYYAHLSPSGVGSWTSTAAYPVQASGQACAISSGYIYCVGGETAGGSSPTYTNAVYFAPTSSGGIGTWKQATDYPNSLTTTCAISSGSIYCIGGFDASSAGENGDVYYASLSSLSGTAASG